MRGTEWRVSVRVKGSISFHDPFLLNGVEFRSGKNTISARNTVSADSSNDARDIAIRNISDVLDLLSYVTHQHLEIEGGIRITGGSRGIADLPASFTIRRILDIDDIVKIEEINDLVNTAQKTDYQRALSYYRNGMGSVDPFDSFVSFWKSCEIIFNQFSGRSIKLRAESFYSEINESLPENFIRFRDIRNNIAHGSKSRDINEIRFVSNNIPDLQKMTDHVLQNARENQRINQKVFNTS